MKFKSGGQPILIWSAVAVATIVILIWGGTTPPSHAFDDAYITYRYADNVRRGLGLVYNPGDWVLGTTTPLFALLLGILGLIFTDIEVLGHWLGVISWIAAAWAVGAIFWQEKRPYTAMIAPLFMALQPAMLNVLGMETPLVVALLLASAWAWLGNRSTLAAILLAALILVRLDGALWALIIGVEMWRRNGRPPWRVALLTVLLAAPWFLYAQWQYGNFLPNSVVAKTGQITRMAVGGQTSFIRGFVKSWSWMSTPALISFSLLVLAGMWAIVKDLRKFWWIPIWIILYLAAYTVLGVANFPWYYTPLTVVIALLAAMGTGRLLGEGAENAWAPQMQRILAALAFVSLFVLTSAWFTQGKVIQIRPGYRANYPSIGHWLNEHTPEDARVATIEIGVIGFFSQRPILDTMGLVSPEMTRRQVGWIETVTYAVSQQWPDYVVALENTAWDWVTGQWWFQDYYQPVAVFDSDVIYQLQKRPITQYRVTSDALYLAGFTMTGADFNSRQLLPGGTLETWLHLDVDERQPADYQLTAYLINAQTDERTAITKVYPLNGGYNATVWQPGDTLALPIRLQIPDNLTPGAYQLGLFIYDPESNGGLPTTITPPNSYPEIKIGWLRYGRPDTVLAANLVAHTVQAKWQGGIQLENIMLPAETLASGQTFAIGLQWLALRDLDRDLTVFVHFVNETGDILAQQDQRPFAGRFPIPSWIPGEQMLDQMQIHLPSDIPAGNYGLRIGLYDENGRLPLDENKDFLLLANSIQVNK
jgi:hypothetical protein